MILPSNYDEIDFDALYKAQKARSSFDNIKVSVCDGAKSTWYNYVSNTIQHISYPSQRTSTST